MTVVFVGHWRHDIRNRRATCKWLSFVGSCPILVRKILRDRANPPVPTTLKGGDTVLHARTTLVLYHRDGAMVAQLDRVGRSSSVARRRRTSRSRIRACRASTRASCWDDQGHLGRGSRAARTARRRTASASSARRSSPGDEIAIGPVRVVDAHHVVDRRRAARLRRPRSLRRRARRRAHARAHVPAPARAAHGARASAKDGHVSRWASRLRSRSAPVDRVGDLRTGGRARLAARRHTPSAVQRDSRTSSRAASHRSSAASVTFPADGASVDELIAAVQRRDERARRRVPMRRDGRRQERRDEAGDGDGQAPRAVDDHRADPRRDRHRQGSHRARDPRRRAAQEAAAAHDQLRRDPGRR